MFRHRPNRCSKHLTRFMAAIIGKNDCDVAKNVHRRELALADHDKLPFRDWARKVHNELYPCHPMRKHRIELHDFGASAVTGDARRDARRLELPDKPAKQIEQMRSLVVKESARK